MYTSSKVYHVSVNIKLILLVNFHCFISVFILTFCCEFIGLENFHPFFFYFFTKSIKRYVLSIQYTWLVYIFSHFDLSNHYILPRFDFIHTYFTDFCLRCCRSNEIRTRCKVLIRNYAVGSFYWSPQQRGLLNRLLTNRVVSAVKSHSINICAHVCECSHT